MTTRRIASLVSVVCLIIAVGGCGTSPVSHFYTLDPTASPVGAPVLPAKVMVGPITMPASVDRPEFVVRVANNQVKVDEFNRWDAPLDDIVARTIAGDLSVQLGSPDVTTTPLANFRADYWVTVNVERFESSRGNYALVESVWTVRRTVDGETRSGRTSTRESVKDDSFDALAAAHSRALASLSDDIASAIRSLAGKTH
ncbi:MAG TPA: PqiC family protein [Candidatus Binataceae bacterium]|nr:PqiC family protein [Candidatus Binataceae bacterium]